MYTTDDDREDDADEGDLTQFVRSPQFWLPENHPLYTEGGGPQFQAEAQETTSSTLGQRE